MSKNREVRELQFSSTQLIILFLAILVLGIFIFLLGVSVGKKQTRLTQEASLGRNMTYQPKRPALPAAAKEEPQSTAIDREIASHTRQSTAPKTGAQPQGSGSLTPSGKTAGTGMPMVKTPATPVQTAPSKAGSAPQTQPQTQPSSVVPAKTKTGTAATPASKTPAGTTRTTSTQPAKVQPKATAAKTVPAKPAERVKGYYYIQLAAFDERPAAVDFAGQIRAAGYPALVLEPTARDKKPWYRVRVGGYATKEEAESAVQKLRAVVTGRKFEYWITRD